ncbi:DUF6436 domain-containing protein [Pseudoalteromonas sp. MTN2-4]|uniref:DUF6436 domain-containing protein n=1 Tax=Pseudoalteromonas sp. MTN2-4 TaxID=3056555 RepID=UPI0036F2C87E
MKFDRATIIFLFWAASLLLAVLYASSSKLKSFDPNNQLHQAALQTRFDKLFLTQLQTIEANLVNTVFHFRTDSCFCHTVAQGHIASVEKLAERQTFRNIKVNLVTNSKLKRFIPSVPAVAVVDEEGKLSYLGPYASGMFCTQGNGLVEPFIKRMQGQNLGATVISQSQGCYCALST